MRYKFKKNFITNIEVTGYTRILKPSPPNGNDFEKAQPPA